MNEGIGERGPHRACVALGAGTCQHDMRTRCQLMARLFTSRPVKVDRIRGRVGMVSQADFSWLSEGKWVLIPGPKMIMGSFFHLVEGAPLCELRATWYTFLRPRETMPPGRMIPILPVKDNKSLHP